MAVAAGVWVRPARAGEERPTRYKVLEPIAHENLTIFPVVAANTHDTSEFITLDEGIRSGQVIVTESGNVTPLMRRGTRPVLQGGPQVNTLVLINNADKPLILLAGEIVTGGKQDRVIGKDRLIPAHSDPVDLGVFCVEPGRWVGANASFNATAVQMAQPSVRSKAMADKNQSEVWAKVREQQSKVATQMRTAAPTAVGGVTSTTSYAKVMGDQSVQKEVDKLAAPVENGVLQQLKQRHAVGVVVAVNGRIIWADVFASPDLLQKYWPKLVRSYAAEAFGSGSGESKVDVATAQQFLNTISGNHETVETEPGVFRWAEISGAGYKAFELTSLLPKTDFELHVAKMVDETRAEVTKPVGAPTRPYVPIQ
jgi:hypothetical protein